MIVAPLLSILLLASTSTINAFAPVRSQVGIQAAASNSHLYTSINDSDELEVNLPDRRQLFQSTVYTAAAASASLFFPTFASAEEVSFGTDASSPIAIIGAGGKVGSMCLKVLNSKQLYTKALTRSGRQILPDSSSFVTYGSGDVTNYEAIKSALQGCSSAIFAASASGKAKGGDPAHVDYLGLYNTAKACLELGVTKLVVVSAGSVTRPDFVGFKATNFFVKYVYGDKIMDYKIAGESVMRDLYAQQDKCAYCVVRPGGLADGPAEGPSNIHVSQGDVYSAEINREDVAEMTVAALLKGSASDNTTFELNNIKGLSKVSKDLVDAPKELVHAGAKTYGAMLDGLITDAGMKTKYPQYMNDFRGDKIEPVSKIV